MWDFFSTNNRNVTSVGLNFGYEKNWYSTHPAVLKWLPQRSDPFSN